MEGPLCHTLVRGGGDPSRGVIIVGISPGQDEEQRSHKTFTGPSGKLLDAVLESCDWPRAQTYTTNLICWWKNAPDDKDINKCKSRLISELTATKPKLIIPLGTIPSMVFTGKKVSAARGVPIHNSTFGCWVMPTYHPSAILHDDQGKLIHDLVRDLSKIPIILGWRDDDPSRVNYVVCASREEAQEALFCAQGLVSCDIETNYGLETIDIFGDPILCWAITYDTISGEYTYVFPYEWGQDLEWPQATWVYHNGMFDTQGIMRHLGVKLPIKEDTLLMSYLLDEREEGTHRLKPLAREFAGSGYYDTDVKAERKRVLKDGATTEYLAKLYDYNARDAAYTRRLWNVFKPRLTSEGLDDLYYNLIIPAANTFRDMNYRGVYANMETVRELGLEWFPMYIRVSEELQQLAKDYGWKEGSLNPNSPPQMQRMLFDTLKLPSTKKTKTGAPSTDEEVLDEFAGHPFVDKLHEYRQLDHMTGTYIIGLVDDIKYDSRLHPNVLIHGTVTGRTSYRTPPLQTIPRDYKPGQLPLNKVRKIFSATNDEYVILEADFKQIELWVAYFYSGDQHMLNNLMTGDFHGATARDPRVYAAVPCIYHTSGQFDCPDCVLWDYKRTNAKRIGFGIMYGRTEYGLSKGRSRIADTPTEARPYLTGWWELYPEYRTWYEKTQRQAIDDGYLRSRTGRYRRFRLVLPEYAPRITRQAVNFPIQSTAGDYTLDSLIELYPLLQPLDTHPLMVIHDSIVFEVRRKYFDEAVGLIREVMEKPRFGFPSVRVDMKAGNNWLEVHKIAA